MKSILGVLLVMTSFLRIEVAYTGQPMRMLWGDQRYIHYDPKAHVWFNENTALEAVYKDMDRRLGIRKYTLPERVPEKKETRIRFNLNTFLRRKPSVFDFQTAMACAIATSNRREGRAKKVLFVNGPSQDPSDRFFGWPTPLLYAIAPTVEAIRNGSLELVMADEIFDPWCYIEGVNSHQVKHEFLEELDGVDIVCASAIYDSLYPTLQLFAEAKRADPEIITILGGPHFDEIHHFPVLNDIANNPQLIDYAVAGDGEIVLRELLRELSNKQGVDLAMVAKRSVGQAWLYDSRGARVVINAPLSLDNLPITPIELAPNRHRLDFDIFTDEHGILPTTQMIAARGCPYSCSFCSERKELAYPNVRSIGNIIQEIELRKQQGFKVVFFDDSTFGAYPRLRELLCELGKTGMKFGSLNRFNHLTNPAVAEMYRKAGFIYVYCSIEQFDDNTLKIMTKGQTTAHIARGMRSLSNAGISVGVSLLYGFPYETEDSINATLDFTNEWVGRGTVKLVSESVLSFHPGTPEGQDQQCVFNRRPPHLGYPWDRFEEGQWYHPSHVTAAYLEKILAGSEQRFSHALVRNRHSWIKRA